MLTRETAAALSGEELRCIIGLCMSEIRKRESAGSRVARLAAMKVGDTEFFAGCEASNFAGATKPRARRRMGDPEAMWSGRGTNKGFYVTRTR